MICYARLHFFLITFLAALCLFQATLLPLFHSLEVYKEAISLLCGCTHQENQIAFRDHCEKEAEHNHHHSKDCISCTSFSKFYALQKNKSLLSKTLLQTKRLKPISLSGFSQFFSEVLRSRSPPAFIFPL